MRIVESIKEMEELCKSSSDSAVVPTMGALHSGHVALLKEARKSEVVIATLFVNPLQFNDSSDYELYPRTLDEDINIFNQCKVDILFKPSKEDILRPGSFQNISAGYEGELWEGKFRKGHFDGVLTIVNKIFQITKPRRAIFGTKDIQQVALISDKLGRKHNVDIVSVETVRNSDGLAFSSRNRLLSDKGLSKATIIYNALREGVLECGKGSSPEMVIKRIDQILASEPDFKKQYAGIDFFLIDGTKKLVILVAGFVEGVRLIDNMIYDTHTYEKYSASL
ncbi:MAG: pantoate--beta-alanine ligase [Dehalococcoidia bacterium]|nr:pantoate--beta-alanine ligase [Dehalococcoidia bacterium]|tara:strand:- start:372 stop:1211 length:840 start_codon:yes stop_codon:yes gene_type:complete